MPVGFWNDPDGARYREAYFDVFPGVWRHGDWITITDRGTCVITGRSDATLNRGGVRLGTSEFYSVVEGLDEVLDSVVVHLEDTEGGAGELLLFVVLADGVDARRRAARPDRPRAAHRRCRRGTSRTQIYQVARCRARCRRKKLEVPVKRILTGTPVEAAAAKGALANPESLAAFERPRRRPTQPGRRDRCRSDVVRLGALAGQPGVHARRVEVAAAATTEPPTTSGASSQSTGSGSRRRR